VLAGQLGQRALSLGEPGPPCVQRLLSLLPGLRVTALRGLRQLALQLTDRRTKLVHGATGARQCFRVGSAPVRVLRLAHCILDPAQAAFKALLRIARERSRLLPFLLDPAQRGANSAGVGHRQQLFRLGQQLLLGCSVLAQVRVLRGHSG
jgi:hypothetical protein